MSNQLIPSHPGVYVRENILNPRSLTVTDAAKLIGISRPGLSNFLNGKVSATADMASRLERAFGVSAKTILDLQTAFEARAGMASDTAEKVRTYVPPFLSVQANQLANWFATTIQARTKFSVLLRTLIHSTARDLEKVDFPGNDDAERPGWDGLLEANVGTPWVPFGVSGWEFGVTEDIKGKADDDFAKSVRANVKNRESITFVFVTPRRWPSKAAWIAAMKAKELWKDVRAYDSSDLEQWIEQSPAAQVWFANQVELPSEGARTLARCWTDWANVTEPPLHPLLFATAKDVWYGRIKSFFEKDSSSPLVIAADSVEEALAFLSQVLATPELQCFQDRVLVFDRPGVLPKLAQGATDFIAVAHTRDVEREFGPFTASLRTIVIYPRNAINGKPDIVLEPLGHEAFTKALEAMTKTRDQIRELTNASGRSLTVLRRQLCNNQAVRAPVWASDHETSSGLIPLVLIGAWDTLNEADRTALSRMAGEIKFEVLEKRVVDLLRLNDSPVWSIGGYRGVVSKIDSLFAISGSITESDLERFLRVAKLVLEEDDPALDLPEEDRWAAAVQGKRREFSGAVREGISESLVLLAVHGKNLFGSRLGFNGEYEAAKLVRELLEPINTRKLEANDRDLPLYAEAAPDEFLSIIDRDLRTSNSQVIGLLRPVNSGFFGSACPRTGLLWALEGLAWNPSTFPRVIKILGRLAEVEIKDNWSNKPIGSLSSIFRAWMPQTAADIEMRLKAVRMLLDKHPAIGWKVCLQQFGDFGDRVGHYNHKPKWRQDGYGHGEPFKTWEQIHAFVRETVALALCRTSYTAEMLCDLVSRLRSLASDDQGRVWGIIEEWHDNGATDEDIAKVREKIRITVLSRRGLNKIEKKGQVNFTERAKAVYTAMQPQDIVNKHEWLFRQGWVHESADELEEEGMDFQARERRIEKLRFEALADIVREKGLLGIFSLSKKGNSQRQIGSLLVSGILHGEQVEEMILQCLRSTSDDSGRDGILSGALWRLGGDQVKAIYTDLQEKITTDEALSILLLSPYRASTWGLVSELPADVRDRYWDEVTPQYIFDSVEDNNESVRRLIAAGRPIAAFASIHFKLEDIRPNLLVHMLSAMAYGGHDKPGEFQLSDYDLQRAFELLNNNADVSAEEKAGLEFAYLDVLARSFRGGDGHQIPNLERYIEEHPEMFVQAVVWAYKRKDRGEDPPEFRVDGDREYLATRGYRLLDALERIPGQDKETLEEQGQKLLDWISAVRSSCADLDRGDIADVCIGKLLSHASSGKDGIWPNEVVRDVMEDLQSEDVASGAHTGLYNARGAHWRGEGGNQERELADKYRSWADALQFTHPFVSSSLLMGMVKTYEREAERQDTEEGIRRRLRH
ncbi:MULTISPECIES: HigA family addiction module antitoxin [unclassified Pseudomonas]|uniref:HigA family addiction module antitoxin n=1 Tax=unclassified Pseudomonas TaxID=196821 RepID=UPI001CBD2271|nr:MULTISPECIES: HigA family addiction module antitoxin [unclassified Pseudomonas]